MKRKSKRAAEVEVLGPVEDELYKNVRSIIAKGRAKVYVAANTALVETYWKVGREIVEKQGGFGRATYGNGLIDSLARRLTAEFGSGYTRSNLRNMRQFYTYFQNCHTVCGKLNWSHFRTLITIEDAKKRQFYLEECEKAHWSVRDLRRQVNAQFYERLLHRQIKARSMNALVKRGSEEIKDIIRSPAILEFTGIDEEHYRESDLQRALVKNLRKFMMELGRGFCLEREQAPIPIGDETYHCDLVFYNYRARCFFLIDLKVGKVTPQDIGQMQFYKHYYERNMMNPGDNPPVGIVLGSETDRAIVEYTLNEHERNLFAVKYHLHLPTVEELQIELQRERAAIEEAMLLTGKRSTRAFSSRKLN